MAKHVHKTDFKLFDTNCPGKYLQDLTTNSCIHSFVRLFVRSFRFYWSWRSFGSVEIWRHFLCTFARHLWVNPRIRQGCCECSKMHRIILLDLVCQISQSHRHVMQTAGFLDNDGKPVDVPRSTTMHYFGPGRADSLEVERSKSPQCPWIFLTINSSSIYCLSAMDRRTNTFWLTQLGMWDGLEWVFVGLEKWPKWPFKAEVR
jgi:hypothetical protein